MCGCACGSECVFVHIGMRMCTRMYACMPSTLLTVVCTAGYVENVHELVLEKDGEEGEKKEEGKC